MTPEQSETLYRTAQLAEDQSTRIDGLIDTQTILVSSVAAIEKAVIKQKGFIGGVLWLWSFLTAGALAAWGFLKDAN